MAKGFKQPQSARGAGNVMSQIAKLQEQMVQAQEELANETVSETVGGGAVTVVMTGDQQCKAIKIDPDVIKDGDVEMLQDLIISGINKAMDSSKALSEQKMAPFTNILSGMGMGR